MRRCGRACSRRRRWPCRSCITTAAICAASWTRHGAGIIVVDALYSTNGSVAPLLEMVEIAERSGSMLIVDESHSLGTHGPQGAGLVAELGLAGPRPFPYRLAGQGVCRARRADHLLVALQGLFPVGLAPGHFQLLPARARAGMVRRRARFHPRRRRAARRPAPAQPASAPGPAGTGLQRQRRHGTDHRARSGHRTGHPGAAQGAGTAWHLRRRVLRAGHAEKPRAGAPDPECPAAPGPGAAPAGRLRGDPRRSGPGALAVDAALCASWRWCKRGASRHGGRPLALSWRP